EMSTAWCAWSLRALRAIRLLAQEWGALDAVQLQAAVVSFGPREGQDGTGTVTQTSTMPDMAGLSLPYIEEEQGAAIGERLNNGDEEFLGFSNQTAPRTEDDLSFLFNIPLPGELDAFVKDWLTDNGAGFF
ncbi:hypothetical protein NW755_012097, partial [Fusarium falciforme]